MKLMHPKRHYAGTPPTKVFGAIAPGQIFRMRHAANVPFLMKTAGPESRNAFDIVTGREVAVKESEVVFLFDSSVMATYPGCGCGG
jgi:hypothetical protein